jgi:hypothetical protein
VPYRRLSVRRTGYQVCGLRKLNQLTAAVECQETTDGTLLDRIDHFLQRLLGRVAARCDAGSA